MFKNIFPILSLLALTVALWGGSTALSDYLSRDLFRKQQHAATTAEKHEKMPEMELELPEHLLALKKEADAGLQDAELQRRYAVALRDAGYHEKNGQFIMEAVRVLVRSLEHTPNDAEALLNVATICLENGLTDMAISYYERFRKVRPGDTHAEIDYSLALIQAGRAADAVPVLEGVTNAEPKLFQASFALALALQVSGDIERAKEVSKTTLALAPDAMGKEKVQAFIASLDEKPADHGTVATDSASPATLVTHYFQQHEIIGPKLTGIHWSDAHTAQVLVENFPIEHMPEIAKQSFIKKTEAYFSKLQEAITIVLVDSKSKASLLTIPVGGGKE